MTGAIAMRGGRVIVWLLVGAGLLLVALANWHLVHVAMTSEPGCVAHLRPGEDRAGSGGFSAAESSCTPPPAEGTGMRGRS